MQLNSALVYLLALFLISEKIMAQFQDGIRTFTASVYKQVIIEEQGNFFMSPLSVELLLTLMLFGAKNETKTEIRNTLQLPETSERVEENCKMTIEALHSGQNYMLRAVNRIFVDLNFPLKETFKITAAKIFNCSAENVEFAKNVQTANTINRWIETQTDNKIQNLISPDIFTASGIILVNALYFKGKWVIPFEKYSTRKNDFFKISGEILQVDTMFKQAKFPFYENINLDSKFLEMRFEGEDISLIMALPNQKNGIFNLEKQIDQVIGPHAFRFSTVIVALPKFKIQSTLDFKPILINLGIRKAFSSAEADFSGISDKKGDVNIRTIVQKTFIEVDEEGAEAAAATFVGAPRMMPLNQPAPEEFIADHPFLFYIQVKNIIVFVGKITEPNY